MIASFFNFRRGKATSTGRLPWLDWQSDASEMSSGTEANVVREFPASHIEDPVRRNIPWVREHHEQVGATVVGLVQGGCRRAP